MDHEIRIIGNVGNVPEMRYQPDGTAVTNFSVATNKRWKDAGGADRSVTTWFRVSTWGKMAETMNQYLEKGALVMVRGELSCDEATGGPKLFKRGDGTVGATYEVKADKVKFLSSKNKNEAAPSANGTPATAVANVETDDIPF
jgi:single-strand DNA-binding protein